jgi:tetratricopeptide (TPR) repeat protein
MKKLLFIILLCLLAGNIFSQDIWEQADAVTKELFLEVDTLIEQKKYLSAFNLLNEHDDNEYILAKKTDIFLNYFAQSLMHILFGLKDLDADESLSDVRTGTGEFTMVMFNPSEVLPNFQSEHGISGILELYLGKYYSEVFYKYNGQWMESNEEVMNKCIAHYKTAFEMGYETVDDYEPYAIMNLRMQNTEEAITYFTKLINLESYNGTYFYNLSYAYLLNDDYMNAGKFIDKAIELYADNIDQQIDAYMMAVDIHNELGEYNTCLDYLNAWEAKSQNDYRVSEKRNLMYLKMNRIHDAASEGKKLFNVAPKNPTVSQMLLRNYYTTQKTDELKALFHALIQDYSTGNKDEALRTIDKAKIYFEQVFSADNKVFGAIEERVNIFNR